MEDFWMEHRYSSCCYQLEPHYEHTYQLVFLLKGKILYQVGEKQYEVSKGGMILLNSLEVLSVQDRYWWQYTECIC